MKPPQWLAEEIAALGARVLDGKMTRAEADAAIATATRKHPEFLAEAGGALALRLLGKWIGEHSSSGDLFQAGLFPGLPAVMRVAPQKAKRITEMTGEDLDHAKNMMLARTQNAIDGARDAAEREREAFMDFYNRVRALLTGELTVADVLDRIQAAA